MKVNPLLRISPNSNFRTSPRTVWDLPCLTRTFPTTMKKELSLIILLCTFMFASSAPPTCYSRVLSLSQGITETYVDLQKSETVDPCVKTLPTLYLDIHNYCVLAKLREFVAYPQCWQVPQVNALKAKARLLYTIMISFCRQDLVFLSDDCSALEIQILPATDQPTIQN